MDGERENDQGGLDPEVAKMAFTPSFQRVTNGSLLDRSRVCRDFMERLSTPALRDQVSQQSDLQVADTMYFYMCQLCTFIPTVRGRWAQCFKEKCDLEEVVVELGKKNEEYEKQLGDLAGETSRSVKVKGLEKELQEVKDEMTKQRIEFESGRSDMEIEVAGLKKALDKSGVENIKLKKAVGKLESLRDNLTKKREEFVKEVSRLKSQKNNLLGERRWLIGEGFRWCYEQVLGSTDSRILWKAYRSRLSLPASTKG